MTSAFLLCQTAPYNQMVKSFWLTEGTQAYGTEIILPKGDIEIIFSFADGVACTRQQQPSSFTTECFVNGISNTFDLLCLMFWKRVKQLCCLPSSQKSWFC